MFSSGLAGVSLIGLRSADMSYLNLILLRVAYSLDLIIGIWLIAQALKKIFRSIVGLFLPQREEDFIDIVYQKKQLARGPKIVVVGGGTGLSTILHGLKQYTEHITAVVTVADDGGSSGRLRQQFDILPPGDIRNCLVALADTEPLMRRLFQFRFDNNSEFAGHSFGNLFLVALSGIYGGDIQGIKKAAELLDIKGRVLPVSLDKAELHATLEDGTEVLGETNIDVPKHDGSISIKNIVLKQSAHIYEETADAIRRANIVVIGPGDSYTSIIPNLIVEGMRDALRESGGKKVFVCNLMTKWGETNDYDASDIARELLRYSGLEIFDYAICNTETMDPELVKAYAREKKYPVRSGDELQKYAKNVITGNFFSESDIARHDSAKLAKVIAAI